jgi:hypothetical protein
MYKMVKVIELFGGSKISEGSKKTYLSKLKKLNGNKKPTDLNFLKDTKSILEQIEKIENPNTRRSSFIAVVSVLKDNKKYKKEYDVYHAEMMKINTILNKTSHKSDETKAKQDKVSMDEILGRQKELGNILPIIKGKKKITEEQLEQLHDLVITSLYTLQSPRRNIDYSEMVIGLPTEDPTKNYYNKGKFTFNTYKTKGAYKQQILDVPKELDDILKVWIKLKPKDNEYLLINLKNNTKYKPTDMTDLLKKVFKNEAMGVSVLRNVYLSTNFGDAVNKLKEITTDMGTSIGTALGTYIKPE